MARSEISLITGAILLIVSSACSDEWTNSDVEIVGPTHLFEQPQITNRPIAQLGRGDKARVLRAAYSKDAKFFEVRLVDGRAGYLLDMGKNDHCFPFEVIRSSGQREKGEVCNHYEVIPRN